MRLQHGTTRTVLARLQGTTISLPRASAEWLTSASGHSEDEFLQHLDTPVFETLVEHGILVPVEMLNYCATALSAAPADAHADETALVGVSDISLEGEPACRNAPRLIRAADGLLDLTDGVSFDPATGRSINHPVPLIDLGDLEHMTWLTPLTKKLAASGRRIVALGGDHTITWYALAGLADSLGGLTVLQIDAHSDCATADDHAADRLNHASMMRFAVEHLNIDRVVQYGIRAPEHHSSQALHDAAHSKIEILPRRFENSPDERAREIAKSVAKAPVLAVTIDIDCLDPSIAPAVSHPVPGGLDLIELTAILRAVEAVNPPVYIDIVECADSDRSASPGVTSAIAAAILTELLFSRFATSSVRSLTQEPGP